MNSTKYVPFKYNILFSEIAKFASKKIRNNKKEIFSYQLYSCACVSLSLSISFLLVRAYHYFYWFFPPYSIYILLFVFFRKKKKLLDYSNYKRIKKYIIKPLIKLVSTRTKIALYISKCFTRNIISIAESYFWMDELILNIVSWYTYGHFKTLFNN